MAPARSVAACRADAFRTACRCSFRKNVRTRRGPDAGVPIAFRVRAACGEKYGMTGGQMGPLAGYPTLFCFRIRPTEPIFFVTRAEKFGDSFFLPIFAPRSANICGNSSVGRAQPCQGWGREFESRFPLTRSFSKDLFCWVRLRKLKQTILYIKNMRNRFVFVPQQRGANKSILPLCRIVVHECER